MASVIVDSKHQVFKKRYSASIPSYLFDAYRLSIMLGPGQMSAAEGAAEAKRRIRQKMQTLSIQTSEAVQRWLFNELVKPSLRYASEDLEETEYKERQLDIED